MSRKYYEEEPIEPKNNENNEDSIAKILLQNFILDDEVEEDDYDEDFDKEDFFEDEDNDFMGALQKTIDEGKFETEWDNGMPWFYQPSDEDLFERLKELLSNQPKTPNYYDDAPKEVIQYYQSRPLYKPEQAAIYFRQAAEKLKNVEDDVEIVLYDAFRPTFQTMHISQLRSYITFRTQWKKGVHLDVDSPYILTLINETLMLIGLKNAEEGWQQLKEIHDTYADNLEKGRLIGKLKGWMKDFVAYYNLHNHVHEAFFSEVENDAMVEQLMLIDNVEQSNFYELLPNLCNNTLPRCEKIIGDHEMVRTTVCHVLQQIDLYYRQEHGYSFIFRCAGEPHHESYPMFAQTMFYDPKTPKNYSFEVNATRRYTCNRGYWTLEYHRIFKHNNAILSNILHETERLLRLHVKKNCSLKFKALEPQIATIIEHSVTDTLQQLTTARAQAAQKAAMDAIHIDMGKLQSIRHDADSICQQLTIEENMPEAVVMETKPQMPIVETKAENPTHRGNNLLNAMEQEYLQLLLNNHTTTSFLQKNRLPASVLVEAINEKLYDTFGDNVVDDSDGTPRIIEDYRAELTTLLN